MGAAARKLPASHIARCQMKQSIWHGHMGYISSFLSDSDGSDGHDIIKMWRSKAKTDIAMFSKC